MISSSKALISNGRVVVALHCCTIDDDCPSTAVVGVHHLALSTHVCL